MKKRMIRKLFVFAMSLTVAFGISISAYCAQVTPKDVAESFVREGWSNLQLIKGMDSPKEYIDTVFRTDGGVELASNGYASLVGNIVKVSANTISPQNREQFQIPKTSVENAGEHNLQDKTIYGRYSVLSGFSTAGEDRGILILTPILAYVDQDQDLAFIITVNNQTGHKIQLNGIDEIRMEQDGETIVSGEAKPFDTPMIYSKRSEPKEGQKIYINKGIQNGYPTSSFLKVTFEPGTYKDGLDITELDNVVVMYAPNYDILD